MIGQTQLKRQPFWLGGFPLQPYPALGSPILEANALEHNGVNDMNIVTRTIVIDRQGLELLGHVDHIKEQV